MYKGAREEGKDVATVDGRDAALCRKYFGKEGLRLGGKLLCVEIATREGWFVWDLVAVDKGLQHDEVLRRVWEVGPFYPSLLASVTTFSSIDSRKCVCSLMLSAS